MIDTDWNMASIILASLGLFSMFISYLALITDKKNKEEKQMLKDAPPPPYKSIKLMNMDGVVLQEYKDVYLDHWDKNIYFLSYEYEGKSFVRIDKGENILLVGERV